MSNHRLFTVLLISAIMLSSIAAGVPEPAAAASGSDTFYPAYDGNWWLATDYYVDASDAWDDAHDSASCGSFSYTSDTAQVSIVAHEHDVTGEFRASVDRIFLIFDTSSLPDDAVISSASIQLYCYGKQFQIASGDWYHLQKGTSSTYPHVPPVCNDYSYSHYTGDLGYKHSDDINTDQYNTWTLNSDGRDEINPEGYSKFVLRGYIFDIIDSEPTFDVSDDQDYVRFYMTEKGTNYRPKLNVSYTYSAVPTVTTSACTDIGGTSMTANGEVTDDDGQDIIRRGFTYMEGDSGDPADVIEVLNPSFETGDPPDDWTTTSTFTRDGTKVKAGLGSYSGKLVTTADYRAVYQRLDDYADYLGETITFGAWVWCDSADKAYLRLGDGVDAEYDYHTGSSEWEWLTVTLTVDAGASYIDVALRANTYTAYIDGAILIHDDEILAVFEDDAFGEQEYDLEISGLDNGTSYRVRGFAQSDNGIGYGSSVTGTTVDTPSITTVAASNVASTSARLNSALSDDGGGDCTIKFGWGLSSESAIEDYDSSQTLAGTYNTGQYPYYDVSGLVPGYTYYFRVSATNDAGTTLGSELTFETESGLSPPTNFVGYPESTSISLSWSKGVGSTNTMVRYGTSSYPTTANTSGTLAYFGPSSTYTVESLTSGKTYYFSAWGESGGNYSDSYATLLMTTSGSTGADDDEIDIPGQPSRWFSAPDYTTMSGLGLVYDGYNSALDLGHVPRETGWMLGALFLSALFGIVAYLKFGKKMMIGMIVLTVCLAMGYFLQLIPWWIPLMTLILTIVWSQTHKQVVHG